MSELSVLLLTAVSVGFFHTLLGPDHYIPFIAMAEAGKWSRAKTFWVTLLCGIGHVGSSVVLGFLGIALGIAVSRLEMFEAARGSVAGWILIVFGALYTLWGLFRAYKNRPHTHIHPHSDGSLNTHTHDHQGDHVHAHESETPSLTPWILFTIFIFGPCEPLIPILMYPAAQGHILNVVAVALVFGIVTVGTMMGIVFGSLAGLRLLPLHSMERFSHALAGVAVLACGIAVQFLGL